MGIFIGGAWPYANGSLHVGHIASLLPGDIIARYYRQKGEDVLYVSGSDCNGTPISIRASQENKTTEEVASYYHQQFKDSFERLGFSYDWYTRTDREFHHKEVQKIFIELLNRGLLYEETTKQAYCEVDQRFLSDRFVEGTCPVCHKDARGDQCDYCSSMLDPLDLHNKKCKLCGTSPVIKETKHYYFPFDRFEEELKEIIEEAQLTGSWRDNAVLFSHRYLNEGLKKRAVTRDLPNGIDVPVKGYEGKKIYVWIEAVSGYLTASKEWSSHYQKSLSPWWENPNKMYYVHGKDNIPFHTIIWPSILMGIGNKALPTNIVSNEYVTLEKKKLSTSKNWAVWIPDIIEKYDPDTIRYFLTINAPENRDADFSWSEFIYSHNSELLGAYGNFVNRTLKFVEKSFASKVPQGSINVEVRERTKKLYKQVGALIEKGSPKQALEQVFNFIRESNKYFDAQAPWIQIKENQLKATNTIATCMYIVINLSQLLYPFLPFSSKKVQQMTDVKNIKWQEITDLPIEIKVVTPLFERLDKELIEQERITMQERFNQSTL